MKKIIFLSSMLVMSILMLSSCNSNNKKDGAEYTSAYICPMHCKGSGSDQPGTCPVCKMDYEKNTEYKVNEVDVKPNSPEDSNTDHDGHNHDGHEH